ncbi:hypothetical protein PoB_004347100 [Plakobranchus ocellatus]|uniref:Uncharacterized protein n=1 Tax=Plakobranchus ocellatus TaxID=259542 RepID=A0AAV4BDT4_9GAST|nr:hypothetical protein PoB_004347100 [Plakobranchus ocellatus]
MQVGQSFQEYCSAVCAMHFSETGATSCRHRPFICDSPKPHLFFFLFGEGKGVGEGREDEHSDCCCKMSQGETCKMGKKEGKGRSRRAGKGFGILSLQAQILPLRCEACDFFESSVSNSNAGKDMPIR